jgi:hypothetical protein
MCQAALANFELLSIHRDSAVEPKSRADRVLGQPNVLCASTAAVRQFTQTERVCVVCLVDPWLWNKALKIRSNNSFTNPAISDADAKYKRFGETRGVDYIGVRLNSQEAVATRRLGRTGEIRTSY